MIGLCHISQPHAAVVSNASGLATQHTFGN